METERVILNKAFVPVDLTKKNAKSLSLRDVYYMVNYIDKESCLLKAPPRNLHMDWEALESLLNRHIIEFSHPQSKYHLFEEVIQARDDVSYDVLWGLYNYAQVHTGMSKDFLFKVVGLVRNPYILYWFLNMGIKCGHYEGWGKSTMEHLTYMTQAAKCGEDTEEYIRVMTIMHLLKQFNAWDREYVDSLEDGSVIKEFFTD